MRVLRAGFARAPITPDLGSPAMFGVSTFVDDIWDPLYVTALYLDHGDQRVVLVGADVCGILGITYRDMCKAAADAVGIDVARVAINASHTHSGPYLSAELQALLDPYCLRAVDLTYVRHAQETIAAAVGQAANGAVPVRVSVGTGRVDKVAANRRVELEDGRTVHRYGRPPHWYRRFPEGLIDPDVTAVRFDSFDGVPVGVIVNYACHPTAAGGDLHGWISADFVGNGMRQVESAIGAPCLFLQGTAGDLGTGKWISSTPLGDVGKMGERFAEGILRALTVAVPTAGTELRTIDACVDLVLRPFRPLRELERRLEAAVASDDAGGIVAAGDELAVARRVDQIRRAPVGAVAIGDLALSLLPGEVFVALGLRIKEASPFRHTLVSAYNDTALQYLPGANAFGQGAFEIDGGWCYSAPGDGELLAEGALRALDSVRVNQA